MLSVAAMVLGLALSACCLHDAGVIGGRTLVVTLIFLVTIAEGTFVVLDSDRQVRKRDAARWDEVPPPCDIHLVWPPAAGPPGKDDSASAAANDRDAPERRRP